MTGEERESHLRLRAGDACGLEAHLHQGLTEARVLNGRYEGVLDCTSNSNININAFAIERSL